MIRFCDKEVCSVAYNSIERNELLSYFFSGHMEDIICVMDDTYQIFKGKITYYSLINSDHIDHAIEQDYVVLDESIWENGRKYFRDHARPAYGEIPLLPVLNGEHELLCFAYQDEDANRQLRMLRELQEKPDAKTFCDVYPGFSCVTLNGFNELAYFFAKYIKNRGGYNSI